MKARHQPNAGFENPSTRFFSDFSSLCVRWPPLAGVPPQRGPTLNFRTLFKLWFYETFLVLQAPSPRHLSQFLLVFLGCDAVSCCHPPLSLRNVRQHEAAFGLVIGGVMLRCSAGRNAACNSRNSLIQFAQPLGKGDDVSPT